MKRIALLVAALATVGLMVAAPGTASAGDRNPTTACNGFLRMASAVVKPPGGNLPWGYVHLCWDGSANFAQYIHVDANGFQAPMPVNFYANAWVYRYENYPNGFSGRSSCDGPNGNRHVVPGEIWCRTHGLGDTSAATQFRGATFVYHWNGNEWVHVASGWTDPAG